MGVIYDKSAILVLRSIPALFARTTCPRMLSYNQKWPVDKSERGGDESFCRGESSPQTSKWRPNMW